MGDIVESDGEISIDVTVTNTGSVAGKGSIGFPALIICLEILAIRKYRKMAAEAGSTITEGIRNHGRYQEVLE